MRFGPPIPLLSCLLLTGAGPSGGGAPSLQPPTAFDFAYTDTSIDIQIDFAWNPPGSGPAPESYTLTFVNDFMGGIELNISAQDNLAAQVQGVPYAASWQANIVAKLLSEISAPATLSGTTPEQPYP